MASSSNPNPRVAVVAIITDDQGRVVIGRRIGPLGGGKPENPLSLLLHAARFNSLSNPPPKQRLEPNKCQGWTWKSWAEIKAIALDEALSKTDLFLPVVNLVRGNPHIEETISSITTP